MKPARLLNASTKPVNAVFTDAVSAATLTSTSVDVVFCRLSVKPSTTFVSVLLAELRAMPFTVSSALPALAVRSIGEPASVASKASADNPVAALPSSLVSVTPMRKAFSAPLSFERRLSRVPEASVTSVALTPAPAPLILSRSAPRLDSPAPMLRLIGAAPDLPVKRVGGAPPS